MKPLIRWAGSKRSIVERLRLFWPPSATRYVEPFAGSACLFFELLPSNAVLADLNSDLINCYRAIRNDPELVLACLRRLPKGKKGYYDTRALKPDTLSQAAAAARFLYLNRNCFNGLYRTNKSGQFNVPYGPPKRETRDFEARVYGASESLRTARLLNADFLETLEHVEDGDFVYLDPPYVVGNRRVFTEYLPGSFGPADLERLKHALTKLDERGIPFLVSYADSREARRLFAPWKTVRIWTRRNIAGFSGARRGTYELLATNQVEVSI